MSEDLRNALAILRAHCKSHVCRKSEIKGGKYACGRTVEEDDRCKSSGPIEEDCIRCLQDHLSVSRDKASRLLADLKSEEYVTVYKCGAVFFNVPAFGFLPDVRGMSRDEMRKIELDGQRFIERFAKHMDDYRNRSW